MTESEKLPWVQFIRSADKPGMVTVQIDPSAIPAPLPALTVDEALAYALGVMKAGRRITSATHLHLSKIRPGSPTERY
jgi:hypothetical protein